MSANEPKGSLLIDEVIAPITDVYFDRGCLIVVAQLIGPTPRIDTGTYRLLDRSGKEVYCCVGEPGRFRLHGAPGVTYLISVKIAMAEIKPSDQPLGLMR